MDPTKTGKYVSGRFFSSIKYKANLRGIHFDLTLPFLDKLIKEQGFRCKYSGLPIDAKTRGKITASLDRIDSDKGYTEDNVQFVSIKVNYMKHVLDQTEFLDLIRKIYQHSWELSNKVR